MPYVFLRISKRELKEVGCVPFPRTMFVNLKKRIESFISLITSPPESSAPNLKKRIESKTNDTDPDNGQGGGISKRELKV